MLRNPAYYGKWEWGKRSKKRKTIDRISGYCPPIISEDAFVKVGEILHSNRLFLLENKHRDYLLRGVIKCSICGRTFCGSYSRVGPGGSKEKSYYRCNGHTQWRKLGTPKCESPTLDVEAIEAVVWDDIKTFCKNPAVALDQLRTQHKPFDDTIDARINDVAKQITELKRQEINFLKIAAESYEVSTDALDTVLGENRKAQEALVSYRAWLESEKLKAKNLEVDLLNVAERLEQLGNRIDNATFEERRRAVTELVKEISVVPEKIDGKLMPLVTITYRFNEPCPTIIPPMSTVIIDHTAARAAISGTRSNPAPAPLVSSPSTRNASPVPCSTASISTSKCRASSMRN
jgi:site-specific DNA recombinase